MQCLNNVIIKTKVIFDLSWFRLPSSEITFRLFSFPFFLPLAYLKVIPEMRRVH